MTIKIAGQGTSHSRSEAMIDGNMLVIDEPVARGGTNDGPSPTATAYSALMGCTNVIGHKCASKLGVDIGNLSFAMEVDFDRRGVLLIEEVDVPFTAIRLTVTSDGPMSDEDLQRVAEETDKFCPISKLYEKSGTDLTVTWTKA
ncbi:MAG: OsmC family protein [Pseudomonadota bacterium]